MKMALFLKATITPNIEGGFQRVLVLLTLPHHVMCMGITQLQEVSQDQIVKGR